MLLNSAMTEINKMITLPETIFFLFNVMSGSIYLTDPYVHFICIYYLDTEYIKYTAFGTGLLQQRLQAAFDLAPFKQLWQFPSTFLKNIFVLLYS